MKINELLKEAYINNARDASDILGELRGIGKSFERGQAEMPRGFANRYVSDVWDVYTWIESKTNGFSGIDNNFKSAINDMMKLRGIAKKKEIAGSDDSGMKDGAFGNQVVTVLYPVMQSIDSIKMNEDLKEKIELKNTWMKNGVEMCSKECCGAPVTECTCGPGCKHCDCYKINEGKESPDVMAAITKAIKDLRDIDPNGGVTDEDIKKAAALANAGNPGKAVGLLIKGFNTERKQASAQDVFNDFSDTFFPPEQDDPFSLDNLKRDKIASDFPTKRRRY